MGDHEAPETTVGEKLRHLVDRNPRHVSADGHLKGWNAVDVDPSEYSGDHYAEQFPAVS